MSEIDERIVSLKFDNSNFEKNTKTTMASLDALKEKLNFSKNAKDLGSLEDSANRFGFGRMGDALDSIQNKFSALSVVGVTALATLTNKAVDSGLAIGRAMIDPLVEGGKRRALNMEQAKFQFAGLKMNVEQAMEDASYAVDGTAYSLDAAAKAASQFGASGVQLGDDMKNALRGISGVAAMAGSSFEDISDVFTKVAGQGRLMGDDLNRLGGRGINAAATLGEAFGKTEVEIRKMVSEGKISFQEFSKAMSDAFGEHATKANETYSGSLSNVKSALARIGAAAATPYFEQQKQIFNALIPVINALRDGLTPLINKFFELRQIMVDRLVTWLNGLDLKPLMDAIAPLSDVMVNLFNAADQAAEILKTAFKNVFPGDFIAVIKSFTEWLARMTEKLVVSEETAEKFTRILTGLFKVIDLIIYVGKELFKFLKSLFDIQIPDSTGVLDWFAKMADKVTDFVDRVKAGTAIPDFFNRIKESLDGFKARVKEVIDVMDFSGVSNFFKSLKTTISEIEISTDGLVKIWEFLKKAFNAIKDGLAKPIRAIGDLFGGLSEKVSGAADGLGDVDWGAVLGNLIKGILAALTGGLILSITRLFKGMDKAVGQIKQSIVNILDGVTKTLGAMQQQIKAQAIKEIAIAIAILAGSLILLSLVDTDKLLVSMGALTLIFAELFAFVKLMDKYASDMDPKQFAALAGGIVIISIAMILMAKAMKDMGDTEDTTASLAGLVTTMGSLMGAVYAASKIMNAKKGFNQAGFYKMAIAMILIAIPVRILASAVKDLGDLDDKGNLVQGLIAVTTLLAAISGAMALMSSQMKKSINPSQFLAQAIMIIVLAVALEKMTDTLGKLGAMDTSSLAQGVIAMGVILGVMGGYAQLSKNIKNPAAIGLAFALTAAGIWVISKSIEVFASMDWKQLVKGMIAMSYALGLIIASLVALQNIKGVGVSAASILIVSGAMLVLSLAMRSFGAMDMGAVGKSLLVFAVALGGIVAALMLLPGKQAVVSASAIAIVAAAIGMLVPPLIALSLLSWPALLIALSGLAGSFLIIGLAGLLLKPVVPTLMLLAIAVSLIGAAVLAAGVGINLFTMSLIALIGTGAAGITLLIAAFDAIISKLPELGTAMGEGLVNFLNVLIENTPVIIEMLSTLLQAMLTSIKENVPLMVETLVVIITSLLDAIIELTPKIMETLGVLITAMLDHLIEKVPEFVTAGMKILKGVLEGIAKELPGVMDAAGDVIVSFIEGMATQHLKIIDAGWKALIEFVNGLADSVEENLPDMIDAGYELFESIVEGVLKGVTNIGGKIVDGLAQPFKDGWNKLTGWLGINSPSKRYQEMGVNVGEGAVIGLNSMGSKVEKASGEIGKSALNGVAIAMASINDKLMFDDTLNPTIRPIIDMSNVENGLSYMKKKFGDDPGVGLGYMTTAMSELADSYDDDGQNGSEKGFGRGNGTTFIQNNYSPKALSEAEIYRRTNNQISKVKEEEKK